MKRPTPSLTLVISALALFAVFLVINRDFLLGRAFPIHDADGFFAPFFMFVADLARQGELLTWNPFNNAGSPDFADPQVGALCPILLSYGLIFGDTLRAYLFYFLSIWGLGGLFMLMLARHLGAPLWAAFAIALAFLFCGFFVGHGQHVSFMRAYAFLPALIWRLDVGLRKGGARPFAEAGLCWGLSAIGGYPAIAILNAFMGIGWVVFTLALGPIPIATDERPTRPPLRRSALGLLLLGSVGLLMVAGTYSAFFLAANGYTDRVGGLTREVAVQSGALHPRALATFASPWLATAPAKLNWDYTDISSVSLYAGAFVALLGVITVLLNPRSLWRWALLLCAGGATLAALGQALPVRGWLYDFLPPFRYFRHASVFRGYTIFCFSVLAALGAADLARGVSPLSRGRASRVLAVAASVFLMLCLVCWGFHVVQVPPDQRWIGYSRINTAWIWGGTSVALLLWSLWPGHRWVVRSVALSIVLLAVADAKLCYQYGQSTLRHVRENIGQQWADIQHRRVRTLDGLDAHGLARDRVSNDSIGLGPSLTSKNLLLRVPVLHGYSVLTNTYHMLLYTDRDLSRAATGTQPNRFWFSPHVYHAPLGKHAIYRDRAVTSNGNIPLVVDDESFAHISGPVEHSTPAIRITVHPTIYRPRQLRFNVDAPSDGWLLVTDRWAPYWHATVNDIQTPITRGNFVFRLLPVRKGPNTIDMRYDPERFLWLGALGWLTFGAMLTWIIATPMKRILAPRLRVLFPNHG